MSLSINRLEDKISEDTVLVETNNSSKLEDIFSKLARVNNHVFSLGFKPVFSCLYGSQNYGVDLYTSEYTSDFDYRCVVLPSLDDLVRDAKPVSKVVDYQGGHIEIKDIRCFVETILKMNPSYIECLATPYLMASSPHNIDVCDKISSFLPRLLNERAFLFVKALRGMAMEKAKAMCHPYPTIVHKIEKYGYDGKQVHHMVRLLFMLKDFQKDGTFHLHPPPESKEFLMDLKLNKIPLEEALVISENTLKEIDRIYESYKDLNLPILPQAADEFKLYSQSLIKKGIYHGFFADEFEFVRSKNKKEVE